MNKRNGMMKYAAGCVPLLAAMVVMSGCASSPEPNFYVFSPDEGWRSVAERDAAKSSFMVQFAPVNLPVYLDGPQIVTRIANNQIKSDQFHRWGVPLNVIATEIVGACIARARPEAFVDVMPSRGTTTPGYLVEITIVRLDGKLGGTVELIAQWKITQRGETTKMVAQRLGHYEQVATDETYEAYVEAIRLVLLQLGKDIAEQAIK